MHKISIITIHTLLIMQKNEAENLGMGSTTKTKTVGNQRLQNKRVTKKSSVPVDDVNFAALGLRVAATWATYPNLKLLYVTQQAFSTKTTQLDTFVQQRISEQQARPTKTVSLKDLTVEAKFGIKIVRGYLLETFKDAKKAAQHYLDFGLEKKNDAWSLPTDQQRLALALRTIKQSITTYGYDAKDYGLTYWTDLEANYTAALADAISSDGNSSNTVNQKDVLKKEIKDIMVSLRFLIRANYPSTYAGVLRDFGFQKEKA